jgi:hypothetical protein
VLDQAGNALITWGIHDDDEVKLVVPLCFGDERHGIHDYPVGVVTVGLVEELTASNTDSRVNDGVECLSRRRVREDNGAKRFPVEASVRVENSVAKGFDNVSQGVGAGCDNIPSDLVGVNDEDAVLGKAGRHHALPSCYSAGERDNGHSTTLMTERHEEASWSG